MQWKTGRVSIIYTKTSHFYTKPCFIYTKRFEEGKNLPYLCSMEQQVTNLFWKFIEPRFWWLRQILFITYWFLNFVIHSMGFNSINMTDKNIWTSSIIPDLCIIYFNLLVSAPLIAKRKWIWFIISMLFMTVTYAVLAFWFNPVTTVDEPVWVEFSQGCVEAFDLSAIVLFLWLFVTFTYRNNQKQALEKETLTSELAYLKSQVNPHFLFNTLNNIAVLADLYPERVTPTIIELSNVLRYQLYESEKDTVLLSDEVENLRQNLNLEAMRLNEAKVNISVGGDIIGIEVAPLLFLPFLENAIKHSADPSGVAVIELYFTIINKNTLLFTSKNSKPPVKPKQIAGGLGLKNIQRRLELIYPQKHELSIEDTKDWYLVSLKINITT